MRDQDVQNREKLKPTLWVAESREGWVFEDKDTQPSRYRLYRLSGLLSPAARIATGLLIRIQLASREERVFREPRFIRRHSHERGPPPKSPTVVGGIGAEEELSQCAGH